MYQVLSNLLNAVDPSDNSNGILNRKEVCEVYLAYVRVCIEVKNYTLKRVDEVEGIVRKRLMEEKENITRNEFVSILCILCQEGRISPSILLNC